MFILMSVGFTVRKTKLIDDKAIQGMTNVLLYVVTPCILIDAFQIDINPDILKNLGIMAFGAAFFLTVSYWFSKLAFAGSGEERRKINIYSSVYSNCGFIGFPLLSALFGQMGVLLGSAYVAMFTFFYWTHGVYLYSGNKDDISLKKALINPGVIGTFIGLALFFLKIRLPYVLSSGVKYMASMNTPLAMVVVGTYFVKADLLKTVKKLDIYAVSAVKLIAAPVFTALVCRVVKLDPVTAGALTVLCGCPTAAVAVLFAGKYGLDAAYASELVAVTTLLSIFTLPLVMLI